MKAGIHQVIQLTALALMLCAVIFVGFAARPAAALSLAPTANSKDQMVVIQKLLEQVKDLQKQLTGVQAPTGESATQLNSCLDIKNNFGYQSSDSLTSNEVSALQKFLKANGYLNIASTGFYGPLTVEAVKSFQSASGIEASGYVGTQTRAKIKGITCPPAPIVDYINEDATSSSTGGVILYDSGAKYPPSAVPTVTFKASPANIALGESTLLSWKTTNANGCILKFGPNDNDRERGEVNDSVVLSPTQTTTYTLTCSNTPGIGKDGPTTVKTVTVTVSGVSPTCTLIADKSSYELGDIVKLTWTSKNATYAIFPTKETERVNLALPEGKLDKSGAVSAKADAIMSPYMKLYVYDAQGMSGSCGTNFTVLEAVVNTSNGFNPYPMVIGSYVKTTKDLNVREAPSYAGSVLSVEAEGAGGTVVDGPKYSVDADAPWWKIQYSSGALGWSLGTYLEHQKG